MVDAGSEITILDCKREVLEAPGNVSVAGAVLAITAGGALGSVETTVLMTVEETLEALTKGKAVEYERPGESPAT